MSRRFLPVLLLGLTLASPVLAQHDDAPRGDGRGEKKKPSVEKLIDRYTKALLSSPTSSFPLQKLAELYRQKDGNLDGLIADFEKRAASAAGDDQVKAKLALAGVYLTARRKDDAGKLLDQLTADKPSLAAPHLMRANLAEQEGDKATAVKRYEAALPLLKEQADKERILRALMILALDLKEFDAAKKRHDELVKVSGGSLFVKKELGAELMTRGQFQRAEAEFRETVKAAAGDNRALAPALRDLGESLAKQKKLDEALVELNKARAAAGQQAGIRNQILAILTEVYREQGKLPELIAILEKEGGREFQRVATVGQLYEETGQVDKAIKTYRDALSIDGSDVDVRVRLVHLLQTAGQLDEAIKEYQALIKAAPDSAEYVFELAETLIQRGERKKALDLVADLEKRSADNSDVLATVADFYERVEESARAVKVFERLANLPDGDPQYLVDLGDRYFQANDKPKALVTWKRILTVMRNRSDALAMLGDVYLEHDMPEEALESMREAVKLNPKQPRYKKQLAIALEKTASAMSASHYRYREALQIWEELLAEAGDDALLARDCRNHIVSMWSILHELDSRVAPLQAKLDADPPELESGRLLAEVLRRLNKLPESEAALRKVVKAAPGDEQSMLALERVLVLQRNITGAIDVLKKLVDVNPKKAREYYQRMAQYAAELYKDDDAIEYASRALELSPEDAEGHFRLAQMYRRRQQVDKARVELRKAINKNQKLYKAYFDLAELEMTAGGVAEADRLYRQVVRSARDEEFVTRAARLSMQINLGRGTLESLEHELLPVALGNPQKPVYRRLLVELYGNMTFPLVQAARLGQTAQGQRARAQLAAIGSRAVKPLLDALADNGAAQQRVAIEVLAYVENKGAGPALFNFALGQAEIDLRVRAMIACGALADPALLPRYQDLLAPADGGGVGAGDAIAVAAAWGVARMGDAKAEPLLLKLLESGTPDIRALAAVGLGLTGNTKHSEALAKLARSPELGPLARAAAAHALGELGDASQRSLLLALTESSDAQVQVASLLGLARLEASPPARGVAGGARRALRAEGIPADLAPVVARALLSERGALRKTAMAVASALSTGEYRRVGNAMPVPHGVVTLTETLARMAPEGYSREEQVRALIGLADPLASAASAAVATSSERASIVAELVLGKLNTLVDGAPVTSSASDGKLPAVADAIARASVRGFVALASHPSGEVRKRAVEFLAHRDEPAAREAIVGALDERDSEVCRTALSALQKPEGDKTLDAIVALLEKADNWSLRSRAAEALGRAASTGASGDVGKRIDAALARAAEKDRFALVREASLRALARRDPAAAAPLARAIAARDGEPRLRAVAGELINQTAPK